MSNFNSIGVLTHLSLTEAKVDYEKSRVSSSWLEEASSAAEYIGVLESVLEHLGIKINEDGSVTEAPSA